MISKELLKKVLEINDIAHIQQEGKNELFISRFKNPALIINIYELSHKCKEWAVNKGYVLVEYPFLIQIFNKKTKELLTSKTDKTTILYEHKRIFKACQWILDNTKES